MYDKILLYPCIYSFVVVDTKIFPIIVSSALIVHIALTVIQPYFLTFSPHIMPGTYSGKDITYTVVFIPKSFNNFGTLVVHFR